MQFQLGIRLQAALRHLKNARRLQPVGGQIDIADAVVPDEEIDDFFQICTQCRLAAAEPEIGDLRCALRQFDDFVPGQVAAFV